MRVLGIETSSRRGTVALVEDGREAIALANEGEVPHGERLLPLIDEALGRTGWSRTSLDCIAAGVGPGSFTGLRVGLALAQGIGLGLGRPVVGVGSLRAMCAAVPDELAGPRCALLDAHRSELFGAVYDADGTEIVSPRAFPRTELQDWLRRLGDGPRVLVGEAAAEFEVAFRSASTDLPHATAVARVGGKLSGTHAGAPPAAEYVRPADAIRPKLPRSPLSSREPT